MQKKVVILGGGIIGMFSAYYLAKEGHAVTILDKGEIKGMSSTGNAGMIVPSHVIPLAAPGMISKGVRWMFDSKSPFYVKPSFRKELLSWGWKFYRSANQKSVDSSKYYLRDISLQSKQLYQEIAKEANTFEYEEKGLLMLFQSKEVGLEEKKAARVAEELGLEVDLWDQNDLEKYHSGIETSAIGGVLYKGDAHLQPNKLMAFLHSELNRLGVEIKSNATILTFEKLFGAIKKVHLEKESIEADEFVIAAGAWSSELAKLAGDALRLLPGKGYSFTIDKPLDSPSIPTILCEGKVAVTPFENQLRFGGTMEITDVNDHAINRNRVEGIVNTINSFYPKMDLDMPDNKDVWMGFRPCSPTGLPYIERSAKTKNLIYATGHGMMGLSLAPATGKRVAELI